eukprot:XP_012822679.1 PREDICTED: myb-related transcription factor, partner of profilin-like [Xenopus tropicalis]
MVKEVARQWDDLFGARSCQLTAARRRELWQQVVDRVSAVGGIHRDPHTVYKRFSDLKRCLKKRFTAERARAQKAGVGPALNIQFKPYERRLLQVVGVEVFGGLPGEFLDTDRRFQVQRQRPTVQERRVTRQQTPPEAEEQPQDVSGADEPDLVQSPDAAAGRSGQDRGQGLECPFVEGSAAVGLASRILLAGLRPVLGEQRSHFLSQSRLLARLLSQHVTLSHEVAALRVELQTYRQEQAAQHQEQLSSDERFQNALLAGLVHASAGSAEGSLPGPSFAPQPPPPSPEPRARGRGRGHRRGSDPACGPGIKCKFKEGPGYRA